MMPNRKKIIVYDTTLRDGEQAPGFSMNAGEKKRIAELLCIMGVDVIEAGFPVVSKAEADAVAEVASVCGSCICSALSRALDSDIEAAIKALENAHRPRIHLFVPASDVQIMHQVKTNRKTVLKQAIMAVRKSLCYFDDIQISAMDAGRADRQFLRDIFSAAIAEGVNTVNISDTVGYLLPPETADLVKYLKESVKGSESTCFSIHCHNDLGMATANTLAAVSSGADQVECTVNGIGERAGNAALEEIVIALALRGEAMGAATGVSTHKLLDVSRLVQDITGICVQPNKAVVGSNACAHEAGIHQDGLLKHEDTYQIVKPEMVGLDEIELVLGKHSGQDALKKYLEKEGYDYASVDIESLVACVKEFGENKIRVNSEVIKQILNMQIST